MAKTITVRMDEKVYDLFKKAADGQKRTISNFIEYATLNYIVNDSSVGDLEMNEILKFPDDIKKGLSDIEAGRYQIIG
jgi:hypothetical protein